MELKDVESYLTERLANLAPIKDDSNIKFGVEVYKAIRPGSTSHQLLSGPGVLVRAYIGSSYGFNHFFGIPTDNDSIDDLYLFEIERSLKSDIMSAGIRAMSKAS